MYKFPWEDFCRNFGLDFFKVLRTGIDVEPLKKEVAVVETKFIYSRHPSAYHNGGFVVIPIQNNSGSVEIVPQDFTAAEEEVPLVFTDAAQYTPRMIEAANSFGLSVYQIRILGMASGSMISWHSDISTGTDVRLVARLHIPIFTNEHCRMKIGHQVFHMEAGSAYWVDAHAPHCVANMGDTFRSHLVFDLDYTEFMESKYSPGYRELRDKIGLECRELVRATAQHHWLR